MAMGCGRGGNEFVNSQTIIIPSQTCKKNSFVLSQFRELSSKRCWLVWQKYFLQVILFHREACEAIGSDCLLEVMIFMIVGNTLR
jgi:hypothetical protein